MRIALGRLDAVMPEQFLDEPDIHAVFEKVRRKAMAEGMKRGALVNARFFHSMHQDQPRSTLR